MTATYIFSRTRADLVYQRSAAPARLSKPILTITRQQQNIEAVALHAPTGRNRYGGVRFLDYDRPRFARGDFLAANDLSIDAADLAAERKLASTFFNKSSLSNGFTR